jgi:pSer/pThr/pTyr-binding forkhead associated (FHA) protein
VITHLFADGGRVVKSHKRSYAAEVARADVVAFVRNLMKAQHLEMCMLLREGRLDDVIAGRAPGGLSTLEGAPELVARRGAGEAPGATPSREPPPPRASAAPSAVRFRLRAMRSTWGGPEVYEPAGDDVIIGSAPTAGVSLAGERFCAREEARMVFRNGKLRLVDIEGGNGVFVRLRGPVTIEPGDHFLVGDQLLELQANPTPDDAPSAGPTYFYSSPRWASSFRLAQLWEGGRPGAVCVARGTTVQIGRAIGDLLFGNDPLVADQHCLVEEQAGTFLLSDLGSRAGTYVRVTGEREVVDGDEFAVGRTRLRVELS